MMNRDDWAVGVILSASVHPASGGHIGPPLQCVGRVEGEISCRWNFVGAKMAGSCRNALFLQDR